MVRLDWWPISGHLESSNRSARVLAISVVIYSFCCVLAIDRVLSLLRKLLEISSVEALCD